MKLETEFYKLPLRIDVERLIKEINGFSEDEWRAHPQRFEGNSAMILIAANGEINDAMQGPMLPTEKLKRCPYIQQILASFNTVIGRSRLMRLSPRATVPVHTDINYYWRDRLRIHIPIITDPSIRFCCNDKEVNMAAGEVWVFDNWKSHTVINPSDITRIHLVADTTGSSAFWELMSRAERPFDAVNSVQSDPQFIEFKPDKIPDLKTEMHNASVVMHPGELELLLKEIRDDLTASSNIQLSARDEFITLLNQIVYDWRAIWSVHGEDETGWSEYNDLLNTVIKKARNINQILPVASNNMSAVDILISRLQSALNPELGTVLNQSMLVKPHGSNVQKNKEPQTFDRPIFIVAAPRSGSTLLFESLARNRGLWTIGGESHQVIEEIDSLNPIKNGYYSNQLTAADVSDEIKLSLKQSFFSKLQDSQGRLLSSYQAEQRPTSVRFLEKTPKNALRIPFIKAIFPDALFVYLHRQPRENISSIIDAWRSGKFITYRQLPGWQAESWSLLLPPGWQNLNGKPVNEIAAFQWRIANQQILDDLSVLSDEDWLSVSYELFLSDPAGTVKRICEFAQLPFGPRMQALASGQLPNSRYTLTPPDPDKWRKNEKEVMAVLAEAEPLAEQLTALSK